MTTEAGKIGGALEFDGNDDHVDLPDGFADFTGGFTVAVWAYPTAANKYARFIDFGNGKERDNVIFQRVGTTADLDLHSYKESRHTKRVVAKGAIARNRWQHFAATIDASGKAVLYRDGREIANKQLPLPSNVTRTSNYVARSNWAQDAYYSGLIDDVRIYDHALSAEEIGALARCPEPGREP